MEQRDKRNSIPVGFHFELHQHGGHPSAGPSQTGHTSFHPVDAHSGNAADAPDRPVLAWLEANYHRMLLGPTRTSGVRGATVPRSPRSAHRPSTGRLSLSQLPAALQVQLASRPEVTAQFAATIYGSLDELGHNMAVQNALVVSDGRDQVGQWGPLLSACKP